MRFPTQYELQTWNHLRHSRPRREEAKQVLARADRIVHAGDICNQHVLDTLSMLAPVTAVRGNNDRGLWADKLSITEAIEIEGILIYVIHNLAELDLDPAAAGFKVVVSGHSHRPGIEEKNGVMFLNPGSAGPRRFTLPISLATLDITEGTIRAELHTLFRLNFVHK